jgi:cell wall-associated NlpC family hydrolase
VSYEKMDCWKLAKQFYQQVFNIELKHYFEGPVPDRNEVKNLIYTNAQDFSKVEGEYSFGDILIISLYGIECHIAIYLGEGRMLHTMKGSGSIIDRVNRWSRMISGAYRIPGAK